MKNTMAVILCGDVPMMDKPRLFRIAIEGRNKCDQYFLFKYAIGPNSFRYWESVLRRGGKKTRGELIQGNKSACPFEVDDGVDSYDAEAQTYKVTWKV